MKLKLENLKSKSSLVKSKSLKKHLRKQLSAVFQDRDKSGVFQQL
jgi:hypothetical protein